MELRWLEAFVVVAEELHFGNAAARLRVAQSPLSQTIRKLERTLGAELFHRSTRSVELTAAGHALLPHAREVLEQADIARRAVRASEGDIYGSLSIGFSGVLNHSSLPPLTRAVKQRYPALKLHLVGRIMTQEALHQLDSGQLDIAFVGLPVDERRVHARQLMLEPMGMVVPLDHPLAQAEHVRLEDFAQDQFITPPLGSGSNLNEVTMQACSAAGFYPKVAQEITDPYMILMLVAAGVGVAHMAEGLAAMVPPGAVFKHLDGEPVNMKHGLAWSKKPGSAARDAVLRLADELWPLSRANEVG
ncbi:LysR family transcriptional regulator [Micrococcoides hystricis]|uniref:LysR family transcriptional regulator n=1 Tax=Micrococcoides hystricis TaxID=1572761 RepID=A0ABV6PD80_9MICC